MKLLLLLILSFFSAQGLLGLVLMAVTQLGAFLLMVHTLFLTVQVMMMLILITQVYWMVMLKPVTLSFQENFIQLKSILVKQWMTITQQHLAKNQI